MKRKYISKSELANIKKLDLLTYLKNYEPEELIRNGRTDYVMRTYSSLHISNGLWCWWAKGIGGRNALKFLIEVRGMEFLDAAQYLKDLIKEHPPTQITQPVVKRKGHLILPKKDMNNEKIINYLVNCRKIDSEIVKYCIENKIIYQCASDKSVIFVGFDDQSLPKFACKRATDSNQKMDIYGSDKRYSFNIKNNNSKTLHIFESAIDLLSFMTLLKLKKKDFLQDNYLSIDGATLIGNSMKDSTIPVALDEFLSKNEIKTLLLHLDYDRAGKETAIKIMYHLENDYEIIDCSSKIYKDVNDELHHKLIKYKKNFISL